jgi:hypothetical protein
MSARTWDLELQVKGVSLETLPLARAGEYMQQLAALIGDEARPISSGVFKGSALFRARVDAGRRQITDVRLRHAYIVGSVAHSAYAKLDLMMAEDGGRGQLIDRANEVLLTFLGTKPAQPERDQIISDVGDLDGVVVGIAGADETAHVRLRRHDGVVVTVVVRSAELADKLASKFRKPEIRVHVHGTWRRSAAGRWEPLNVYGDSFDELEQADASTAMQSLTDIPGNGWRDFADANALWKKIRGLD